MTADLIANRYAVSGSLGEGAMGHVYRAYDRLTDRDVALKVLTLPDGGAQAATLRFKQEFRLMTQVRHPHCCPVYEFGTLPDGRPYFTMELVEGHGLDELLPLPQARVRDILAQLLLGLDAVHQLGLVHRDLKAANVRVTPAGVVKLMDFGLMEVAGQAGGQIAGTLAYVAPEIVKRGPVDLRADLYALGALAYELLTGKPPFVASRPVEMLRAHVQQIPVPLSLLLPDIDKGLELVVRRLLEKDPIDRFQGAFQVLDALGHPIPTGYGGSLLSSPMMGREAEHQQLAERIGYVANGQPGGTVLLHGPSGMGKSRMVEELRFLTQLASLPLADAASYEHDATPYAPVAAVLRSLWPALLAASPLTCEVHSPALVRLLPELRAEPAPELDGAGEKRRLSVAVAALLGALAEHRGLVVVLDDWHWTEPLSRELFEYVTKALLGAPALFMLASRYPPEGNPEWVSQVHAIPLAPLDAEGVRRMVTTMLGSQALAPTFVARVAELTEGVPFVIEGLLEHLVATRALCIHPSGWNTDIDLGTDLVPRRLQTLIVGKLNELPLPAQRVARVLAVFGREADLPFLQRATGLAEDDLFAALEALERRQILTRLETGRYRFAQEHFQDFLYANLGGDDLTRLHQAVGEALEGDAEGPHDELPGLERLAALAHHFQRAGDSERTVRYALDAGAGHLALQALVPAERLLKSGLAALRTCAGDHDAQKLSYLMHLATVRRALGAMHGAREALSEALMLAQARGEGLLRAEVLTDLAHVHRVLANWDEALATGEAALAAWQVLGDHAGCATTLLNLSRTYLFSNDPVQAIVLAEAALGHARQADARLQSEALGHLGNLLLTYDAPRAQIGLAYLQEALLLLPALGDEGGLRNGYLLLGNAHQALGEYAAAKEAFGRALAISEELGAEGGAVAALANLALAELATGDFAEAVKGARMAYDRALRMQNTYVLGVSMVVEALAAAHLGKPAEGLPLLVRALDMGRELKHRYLEVLAQQATLEVALMLGDLAGATAAAVALDQLVGRDLGTEPVVRLAAWRAEIAARAGDAATATQALDLAEANGPAAPTGRLRLLRARARLALIREDWVALGVSAREALGLARSLGARSMAAELHGMLGELALATGSGQAEVQFKAMLALADSMGAVLPRVLALFGLAAARPYQPEAAGWGAEAQGLITAVGASLPADARERFFAYTERARVREGNYFAFSLPRKVVRGTGPLLGLTQESW